MGPEKKFKVIICGAGVGGLTAAVALSEYPHIDVEIYEGASQLSEIGAGFGLFPRPWDIMTRLGLESELLQTTESKPTKELVSCFRFRKSDQRVVGSTFYTMMTKGRLILFHRADFQQVLLRKLPISCKAHYSKRLRSYKQRLSGPIELLFEDGSSTSCDVLIGADGLKSAVRRTFLAEKAELAKSEGKWAEVDEINASIDPVWSGTNAYRALIPAEKLRARAPDHPILTEPTQFLGKNSHIVAYPIRHGKMINFVAFVSRHDLENTTFGRPWTSTTETSEFAQEFSGWDPEVQVMIECVEKPLHWAIHTVRPLASFISGNVALIGDAAHAMTPHQGSGAGQAIEDAYILAAVLGHPTTTRDSLSRALHIYDTIRHPMALQVVEKSRATGQYLEFHGKAFHFDGIDNEKELVKLKQLGEAVDKNWEWAWATSVDESIEAARCMLES